VSSLALNPNYNLSHLCLENIKASSIARWHYIMINDIKRNTAFKNAIFKAVKNGYYDVLDIGSGSGLLRSVLFCAKFNYCLLYVILYFEKLKVYTLSNRELIKYTPVKYRKCCVICVKMCLNAIKS
jgi:hypothetical protein